MTPELARAVARYNACDISGRLQRAYLSDESWLAWGRIAQARMDARAARQKATNIPSQRSLFDLYQSLDTHLQIFLAGGREGLRIQRAHCGLPAPWPTVPAALNTYPIWSPWLNQLDKRLVQPATARFWQLGPALGMLLSQGFQTVKEGRILESTLNSAAGLGAHMVRLGAALVDSATWAPVLRSIEAGLHHVFEGGGAKRGFVLLAGPHGTMFLLACALEGLVGRGQFNIPRVSRMLGPQEIDVEPEELVDEEVHPQASSSALQEPKAVQDGDQKQSNAAAVPQASNKSKEDKAQRARPLPPQRITGAASGGANNYADMIQDMGLGRADGGSYGLLGRLIEKPFVAMAIQAAESGRAGRAATLLTIATVSRAFLQPVRLLVCGYVAVNACLCGALGYLLYAAVFAFCTVATGVNYGSERMLARTQAAGRWLDRRIAHMMDPNEADEEDGVETVSHKKVALPRFGNLAAQHTPCATPSELTPEDLQSLDRAKQELDEELNAMERVHEASVAGDDASHGHDPRFNPISREQLGVTGFRQPITSAFEGEHRPSKQSREKKRQGQVTAAPLSRSSSVIWGSPPLARQTQGPSGLRLQTSWATEHVQSAPSDENERGLGAAFSDDSRWLEEDPDRTPRVSPQTYGNDEDVEEFPSDLERTPRPSNRQLYRAQAFSPREVRR